MIKWILLIVYILGIPCWTLILLKMGDEDWWDRKWKDMKLEDFLLLIQDEEARIELEIDDEEDYQYHHFWLSDFRSNPNIAKYYRDYDVSSFSFVPEKERNAQIQIYIQQKL